MRRKTVVVVLALLCVAAAAVAQPPALISYQGKLVDSEGVPVSGSHSLQFDLFAAQSGGSSLWTETHSGVSITGGLFSVQLGGTTALDAAALLDANAQLWLEIVMDATETFSRVQLLSAPYAMVASRLSGSNATAAQLNELVGGGVTTLHSHPGGGADANTLDGLDSLQFLRSDANDVATGRLEFQGNPASHMLSGASVRVDPASVAGGVALFNVTDPGGGFFSVTAADATHTFGATISGPLQTGTASWPVAYNRFGAGAPESTLIADASDLLVSDSAEIEGNLFVAGPMQIGRDAPDDAQVYNSISNGAYAPVSGLMTSVGDLAIQFDLEVGSDLYVGDTITWGALTSYYAVHPHAFTPRDEGYTFFNGRYLQNDDASTQWWGASVGLPQGAVVTGITLEVYDNSGSDLSMVLYRDNPADGTETSMASVSVTGTPGYASNSNTTIANATIDNTAYQYMLWLTFPGASGANLKLYGAVIRYQTTGPH